VIHITSAAISRLTVLQVLLFERFKVELRELLSFRFLDFLVEVTVKSDKGKDWQSYRLFGTDFSKLIIYLTAPS
jgi:hypothetical protein